MVGSTIKVVATAESGNTFESDETEEVGVYEALEILSAEQTGQYTAEVTFSAPISADDKLEVTKGGNKVEFKSTIDDDKLGAELTFTDALTTGEYTVTLTPADEDVDPSSVTFEAKRAELATIEFLNDVLVMKDHYYNEGYAYVKGYDQFGNPKTLSGLNVVSGVGTFKSYDSDTGKITITDDTVGAQQTGAFLTIKEVPVFVQYQEGTNVISANKTLTVSTRAYVDELSFGEIKKNSKETAKRLTLDELSSGLYYVEILDAADQYGNALSAEDLQDQVEDRVLFVIPGDSGAFYTTEKFGELNGKTVLWLSDNDGDAKPGKMDLSITGAGGKTFTKKDVEIFDNPYIDVLTVDYPDLYEAMTESKKLNFSAVDQYGDDINLWDFRPFTGLANAAADDTLNFRDVNGMTTRNTSIKISGGALFNIVEYDTKAKTSKVTINVNGMDAKDMAVFTVTTAGTKVATHTITIGEKGAAAKIANSFPSTKKLDPAGVNTVGGNSKAWNINADIAFTDVNGNAMTRNKNNAYYPYFVDGNVVFNGVDPTSGAYNSIATTALANDAVITQFVWTVSDQKITNAATAYAQLGAELTPAQIAAGITGYDANGEITVTEGTAKDFYITLFALSGGKYYIVDSASTRVSGIEDTVEKKDIVAPGKLYAAVGSKDDETFKVKLTNTVGESWNVDATSVLAGGIFAGTTSGATVKGDIASDLPGGTTATTPVSVYYGGELIGTTDLTYTNVTPVPSATKFKYYVQDPTAVDGTDINELGRSGKKYDKDLSETELNAGLASTYSVDADGVLTIENANTLGDTVKGWVEDQYGQTIAGTVVYLNGTKVKDTLPVPAARNVWEFKNDTQGKAFYVTENAAGKRVSVTNTDVSTVTTLNSLKTALLGTAATITLDGDVVLDDDLVIPDKKTLVIASGKTLNAGAHDITLGDATGSAELKINGTLVTTGDFAMLEGSKVTVSGVWDHSTGAITGTQVLNATTGNLENTNVITGSGHVTFTANDVTNVDFSVTGSTLVLDGVTFMGDSALGGHVQMIGEIDLGGNDIELQSGLVLDLTAEPTITGTFSFAKKASVEVDTALGEIITVEDAGTGADGIKIDAYGTVTGNGVNVETDFDYDEDETEFLATYADILKLDAADAGEFSDDEVAKITEALALFGDGENQFATDGNLASAYNTLVALDKAAAAAAAIDELALTNLALESNVSTLPTAATIKALVETEIEAETNGYKVTVSNIADSVETALTEEGGTITATVAISKDGYTRTIEEVEIINPATAEAAAQTAAASLTLTVKDDDFGQGAAPTGAVDGYTYTYAITKTSADVTNSQTGTIDNTESADKGKITTVVGTDNTENTVIYKITVTASDGSGHEGTQDWTLSVADDDSNDFVSASLEKVQG